MIDTEKLINKLKYRMNLPNHHEDLIEESWKNCFEIMNKDEEAAIEFIKSNYICNNEDISNYKTYITELIDAYYDGCKSKEFVKKLWIFFKSKKDDSKKYYVSRLDRIIFDNDWDEEDWV